MLDALDRVTAGRQGERTDIHNNVMKVEDKRQGNDASYALRRLRKDRPDLHARVLARELSPHKAMVEAGFRRQTKSVPVDDVGRLAGRLRALLTPEELAQLVELLVRA